MAVINEERSGPATAEHSAIQNIFARFAELRKQSKVDAYRYLHEALSTNAADLAPAVIPLKDLTMLLLELENYLKGSMASAGKTPNETLADWLNGVEESPSLKELVT